MAEIKTITFWKYILGCKKILTDKEAEELEAVVKCVRKELS